ncbi:MAG: hypothetical protein ABR976_07865 [Terracidiphilus sp.]|jgi:hypothetical protein
MTLGAEKEFARLDGYTALTLDLNPEALTSTVLNNYLTVKERAMV